MIPTAWARMYTAEAWKSASVEVGPIDAPENRELANAFALILDREVGKIWERLEKAEKKLEEAKKEIELLLFEHSERMDA